MDQDVRRLFVLSSDDVVFEEISIRKAKVPCEWTC